MVDERDVAWPLTIRPDEVVIARPFVLRIARQHALDAHADALHALHGTPACVAENIEADDAVGVYVWMNRNWPVGKPLEHDFWRFYHVDEPAARTRWVARTARGFSPIGYALGKRKLSLNFLSLYSGLASNTSMSSNHSLMSCSSRPLETRTIPGGRPSVWIYAARKKVQTRTHRQANVGHARRGVQRTFASSFMSLLPRMGVAMVALWRPFRRLNGPRPQTLATRGNV